MNENSNGLCPRRGRREASGNHLKDWDKNGSCLCRKEFIELIWNTIRTRGGMILFDLDGIIKFLRGYRSI